MELIQQLVLLVSMDTLQLVLIQIQTHPIRDPHRLLDEMSLLKVERCKPADKHLVALPPGPPSQATNTQHNTT